MKGKGMKEQQERDDIGSSSSSEEEVEEGTGEEEEKENEEEEQEEEEEEEFIPLGRGTRRKSSGASSNSDSEPPPWHRAESLDPEFPLRTLHNEILDLCDLLMPTPDEKTKTAAAFTYVKTVVLQTLGSGAKVDVFGSQLTGLVLPNSDIDTVVQGGPSNARMKLGKEMYRRKNIGEVREVVVLSKAKVPLVKFVHAATGIQVDVCFDQASGLKSGAAAKEMMRQMQPVRPLVMVLKAYMGQRKLNDTYHGGIGSFLLQLMVVALVQKCGREAREKGRKLPTNLGFFLDEFFDFYGNQLNYASTGITLLGKGGGGFFNKKEIGWFQIVRPQLLSLQNPHERQVDVGSNSYKVDVCKRSFKATSLRLKCAFQRAIANGEDGGGLAETGFLKYVVDPRGELADRVLPPPTFCTRAFDEDPNGPRIDKDQKMEGDEEEKDVDLKKMLKKKAKSIMKKKNLAETGPGSSGKGKRKAPGSKKRNLQGGGGSQRGSSSKGLKKSA